MAAGSNFLVFRVNYCGSSLREIHTDGQTDKQCGSIDTAYIAYALAEDLRHHFASVLCGCMTLTIEL